MHGVYENLEKAMKKYEEYNLEKTDMAETIEERDKRMIHMVCKCAKPTDEWHGWECSITEGACMFLFPDSKTCAAEYGEGPDVDNDGELVYPDGIE